MVLVQVMDLNPSLTISTLFNEILENLQETVIAVFSVSDTDSGQWKDGLLHPRGSSFQS